MGRVHPMVQQKVLTPTEIKQQITQIQTFEKVGLEGVFSLEGVWRRLPNTAVVELGYSWLERITLRNWCIKSIINKCTSLCTTVSVSHLTEGKYIWIIRTKNFRNCKTSFRSIFGITDKLEGGDIESAAVYFYAIIQNQVSLGSRGSKVKARLRIRKEDIFRNYSLHFWNLRSPSQWTLHSSPASCWSFPRWCLSKRCCTAQWSLSPLSGCPGSVTVYCGPKSTPKNIYYISFIVLCVQLVTVHIILSSPVRRQYNLSRGIVSFHYVLLSCAANNVKY